MCHFWGGYAAEKPQPVDIADLLQWRQRDFHGSLYRSPWPKKSVHMAPLCAASKAESRHAWNFDRVNQHPRRCSDRKRALQYWDNLFPWNGTHVEDVYRRHVSLEIAPFNFCLDYPDLLFDEHGHAATVGGAWTYHLQICRLKMIDALNLVANARKTLEFLWQPRASVQSEWINSGGRLRAVVHLIAATEFENAVGWLLGSVLTHCLHLPS